MRFEHWSPLHFIILLLTAFLGFGLPYFGKKFASTRIENLHSVDLRTSSI